VGIRTGLSLIPCVCLSGCTVTKWPIGSGCCLEWSVGSVEEYTVDVLDGSGDCRRGRGSFGGKCGASYCKEWDSLCEGRRRGSSQISLWFLV